MSASTSRQRTRLGLAAATAAALVAAGSVSAGPAAADTTPPAGVPATVSADALPTWQLHGVVWSQALVGNTVYATGSFTKARPPGVPLGGAGEVAVSHLFAYDIRTGERITTFNHTLNAQGRVVTASPDGSRVYVGGDFTAVNGIARGHIAAFDTATGSLIEEFNPRVNNQVRAIAPTNSTVFIGGNYQAVGGVPRRSLAAVRASDGGLLPWSGTLDPLADGVSTDGYVHAMVLTPDQSRVVVGGSFNTLNGGAAADGMGSIDAQTGALQPWAANRTIRNGSDKSAINSLKTDGRQIYGTGFEFGFTGNFEGTFAADPMTGEITVVNDCLGDHYDVLPIGDVMYSVGHAHDCSWIRSFPETNPRSWQRALAQTITPTTTNIGPNKYDSAANDWDYNGLPASSVLQWFPSMAAGSFTGQTQAGWSLAGNADYIAIGGEFPSVNGVAQQGLVRMARSGLAPNKRGPGYTTYPARPVPPTTATSTVPGEVKVTFGTAWDYDNELLTYDLFRNGATLVRSTQIKSNFWTLPTGTLTDTGLTPGSTHTYQLRIRDPFGNVQWSLKSAAVTVAAEPPPAANQPPTASFTSSCPNLTCTFTSTSTDADGSIASYEWTFGDGSTSTEANPSKTYGAAGTYPVTLTVTDNGGLRSAAASRSVTVSPIRLAVRPFKVQGLQNADLTWSGATGTTVTIYRNGQKLLGGNPTPNDGQHTDAIGVKGSGTYTYKVCEGAPEICSNSVTVTF